MNNVKVKTSELTGAALDVAVALATGWKLTRAQDAQVEKDGWHLVCGAAAKKHSRYVFTPSTDWSHGGPMIDKYRPDLQTSSSGGFAAYINNNDSDPLPIIGATGNTYLIAACRVVVAAKFGDEIELPAGIMLLEGDSGA